LSVSSIAADGPGSKKALNLGRFGVVTRKYDRNLRTALRASFHFETIGVNFGRGTV
jgi:hypothetical protein